ncbi:MAG: hypothetical protein NTU53_16590 [Planctomycetota bacterium]|nr:hypothetical protein [Planctomycetota bacterium]
MYGFRAVGRVGIAGAAVQAQVGFGQFQVQQVLAAGEVQGARFGQKRCRQSTRLTTAMILPPGDGALNLLAQGYQPAGGRSDVLL